MGRALITVQPPFDPGGAGAAGHPRDDQLGVFLPGVDPPAADQMAGSNQAERAVRS
jgi:hypothetical protein